MKNLLGTFCLIFFYHLVRCESLRLFVAPDKSQELAPIIEHCGEDYFYKELWLVSEGGENLDPEFLRKIHEDLSIPVKVGKGLSRLNHVSYQSCVVICVPIERMGPFLETVDQYSWVPNNVYVIHTSDGYPIEKSKHAPYQRVWSLSAAGLWEKSSVHKLILSINGRNLFFDPFAPTTSLQENRIFPDSNGTEFSENIFGAPRDLGNSIELLTRRNTFQGYEANVALFPYVGTKLDDDGTWSGLEANAMYEICKRMNLTPRVFDPPGQFGWSENGEFFGTLGRLVHHESKLAFNGFFVKDYGTDKLEFTTFLSSDKICVIVPGRGRVPDYLLIVRIFALHSWVLIFFGNSFVALTHVGMTSVDFFPRKITSGKFSAPRDGKLTRVQRLLGTWIFLCFYPNKTTSEGLGLRLHNACGLMLGIVIGGCFTSQLASSFSKPAFLRNIETLEELDASGLEILTSFPNLLNDVFTHTDSSARKNLQTKLKLKNASEIETQVLEKRNAAYLDRKDAVILAENPNGELHVLSEYPREYHLAYPIPKGSPFLERVNTIIGRLQGAGLYAKWFMDMKRPLINDYSQKPVVIRLPHLYIPFFMLFIGLGIAGGIFCSELYGSWSTKRACKKRSKEDIVENPQKTGKISLPQHSQSLKN